jgi:hypothetical protein
LRCFSATSNFSRAPTRSPPLRSATASFISDSTSLHDATTSAQMTYVCAAYVCGGGEWSAYLPVEGGVLAVLHDILLCSLKFGTRMRSLSKVFC